MLYGTLATHTLKNGNLDRRTSDCTMDKCSARGCPCTLFVSSTTILGSTSTATTRLHFGNSFIVMFPVPGPISSTVSVGFSADLYTIESTTNGFFKKCYPFDLSASGPGVLARLTFGITSSIRCQVYDCRNYANLLLPQLVDGPMYRNFSTALVYTAWYTNGILSGVISPQLLLLIVSSTSFWFFTKTILAPDLIRKDTKTGLIRSSKVV